ncbi:MAG: hypothetical protein V3U45_01145 [bacterium]
MGEAIQSYIKAIGACGKERLGGVRPSTRGYNNGHEAPPNAHLL